MMSVGRTGSPSVPGSTISLPKQLGNFALHFAEMCIPMCVGFAIGDFLYFALAGLAGYSDPFTELPVLSVVLVTVFMTAPMTAWMTYRGMPRRAIVEMSAAMPAVAIVLLGLGWLGALPMDSLALLEHGLMMPAMLVPMLARLDLYTGRAEHEHDHVTPIGGVDSGRGRSARRTHGWEGAQDRVDDLLEAGLADPLPCDQ